MTGEPAQPEPWPRPLPFPHPEPSPFPQAGPAPFPDPAAGTPFPDPAAGPAPFPPSYGPPGYHPMSPALQPPQRNRGGLIAAVVVAALVVVAGAGAAGSILLLRSSGSAPAPASAPVSPEKPGGPGEPAPRTEAEPEVDPGPAEVGPFASEYPAEEIYDLNRVCDEDVFYPQSPKRSGKAPHPVVLLVNDDGGNVRYQNSSYYMSQGYSPGVRNTWAPEKPGKVQLAACLDRVKTGAKLRSCKFDDPEKVTVALHSAGWRLRVVEVATGRELLDKAMKGDDRACPYFVRVGADRKIYARASDRSVVNALKALVKK